MQVCKRILTAALIVALIAAPAAYAEESTVQGAIAQEAVFTEIFGEIDIANIDIAAFSEAREAVAGVVPEITAPTAILIETTTGNVLYEKDADARRSPASITKIMTELLIIEAIEAGLMSFDDEITASRQASRMGGSQIYLREGETMTARDMFKSVVVNSANDAAVALAEHLAGSEELFVASMNARASGLGMLNTNFTNCSGLIESDEHYSTVRDIAIMSRELLRHDMIREFTTIWMDSLRGGETMLANTNRLVRYFEGTTGLKTGFTSTAGSCLAASAKRDGVEYISVTLGDTSSQERFENARLLLSYAFATYTIVPATPDSVLPPIKVDLGETRFVQPEVYSAAGIHLTRAEASQITKSVTIASQLLAPVNVGDEIGRLVIQVGDRIVAELPIVAANSSARLDWGDIFAKFLSMLFIPADDM